AVVEQVARLQRFAPSFGAALLARASALVALRWPSASPTRSPRRKPAPTASATKSADSGSALQLIEKLLPTETGPPLNAGTRAPRYLPAMQPPTGVPG